VHCNLGLGEVVDVFRAAARLVGQQPHQRRGADGHPGATVYDPEGFPVVRDSTVNEMETLKVGG